MPKLSDEAKDALRAKGYLKSSDRLDRPTLLEAVIREYLKHEVYEEEEIPINGLTSGEMSSALVQFDEAGLRSRFSDMSASAADGPIQVMLDTFLNSGREPADCYSLCWKRVDREVTHPTGITTREPNQLVRFITRNPKLIAKYRIAHESRKLVITSTDRYTKILQQELDRHSNMTDELHQTLFSDWCQITDKMLSESLVDGRLTAFRTALINVVAIGREALVDGGQSNHNGLDGASEQVAPAESEPPTPESAPEQ